MQAILTATIQVLLVAGLERLTTTRVSERAGVSVGTLYQYFPNKESLLAGILERHLRAVVEAVEAACISSKGRSAETMASTVVGAFLKAKFQSVDTSRALYSVASEVQGTAVVARMAHRSQIALCEMLATASDVRFNDVAMVSFVMSTALVGPVQAALSAGTGQIGVDILRTHLTSMITEYLYMVAISQTETKSSGLTTGQPLNRRERSKIHRSTDGDGKAR